MANERADKKIDLLDNELTAETDEAELKRVLERRGSTSDRKPSPRD